MRTFQDVPIFKLSETISPLCPRDSQPMHYDKNGFARSANRKAGSAPCYHCHFVGCTVCYAPSEGYFTVIGVPDIQQPLEEPGVNLLQCPQHNTWLYRTKGEHEGERLIWRCGVEGCDYLHSDFGPAWPSP